jgi:glycosyltransferase involved in cell wall biosynthesis
LSNKIKILYISHSPFLNGAEICLYNLVKNLNKDIFEPIVLFPEQGSLIEKINNLGIKTYIRPLERWIRFKFDKKVKNSNLLLRSQNIMDIIERESINIVHTNTSVIIEGAIAAKLKSVPHIWHIHEFLNGHIDLKSVIPLPLVYFAMSYLSTKIVSVSEYARSQFKFTEDNKKFAVIYNGVDENNISVNTNVFANLLGKNSNELALITIGLLTEAKGYDNLLEAASLVCKKGYKVKFYWIGGASKKSLRSFNSKIRKLGLKDSVSFLGFRSDIPEIMKSSDLLISSSLNETLHLVVLEAMAAEKAVVVTNCGGTSECVIDGETGYLIPVNDPVKMSERIIELINDSQKRKVFGENGIKYFREKFAMEKYVEGFEKLYIEIINKKLQESISEREKDIIMSFLNLYEQISNNRWKWFKNRKFS